MNENEPNSFTLTPFVLQLAGLEGVGKTTLARTLECHFQGIVNINKDFYLWSMMCQGISKEVAGPNAYDLMFIVAAESLTNNRGVIIDSPVFSLRTLENGQALAKRAGVPYFFVELCLTDSAERSKRLSDPSRLPCQARTLDECKIGAQTIRPSDSPVITVDASASVAECTALIVATLQDNLAEG
ncbi:AAA family ATPase [Amycolatopsis sp. NPDC088138]|uniref:AAA family ATPase n=1 Tax=Amycolatopsis sp. NPDC088138 TaxID=3363938 RepID=UPI0037F44DCE